MSDLLKKLLPSPVYEAPVDPAAPTVPPVVPTVPAKPWWDGKADEKLIGHMQLRFASHLADPAMLAVQAAKSHMEAERLIGVPASQIVRLPTDPSDAAAWRVVHERLGAPKDAKEYAFSGPDGKPLDGPMAEALRIASFENGLSKDAAGRMGSTISKLYNDAKVAAETEHAANLDRAKALLKQQWGNDHDVNMQIAGNTARRMGIDQAAVDALERVQGYDKVMEMFRSIGVKIGEAKFLENTDPLTPGKMTREMAIARKADLMQDTAWRDRYLERGDKEMKEMANLLSIITGVTAP